MVIYADVLFVVNFFITYLLLKLTNLLLKESTGVVRLLSAAAFGGLYSQVIFIDELNVLVTAIGKIIASMIIVLISFKFKRITKYLKAVCIFYFSNMIFLGIIIAIILLFKPNGIALKNSVVYFDLSAKVLIVSAAVAYLISVLIIKLYNKTIASSELYRLSVSKNGNTYNLYAFVDSGNKLKEPFSDYPVIIADKNKICNCTERVIPYNTVGGEGVLNAFKPDKLVVSNGKDSFETNRVYIALSQIDDSDFSAIINPEILNI